MYYQQDIRLVITSEVCSLNFKVLIYLLCSVNRRFQGNTSYAIQLIRAFQQRSRILASINATEYYYYITITNNANNTRMKQNNIISDRTIEGSEK